MTAQQIAVVGGSVIGMTVAWRLAEAGHGVTVYEPSPGHDGTAAAWVAAGMLGAYTESWPGQWPTTSAEPWGERLLSAWARQARDLARAAPEGGGGLLTEPGVLVVGADEADAEHVTQVLGAAPAGTITKVTRAQVRRLQPGISRAARASAWCAAEPAVDNRRLLAALREACLTTGVTWVERRVRALSELPEWADPDAHIVVAAGMGAGELAGLPLVPRRGEVIRLRRPPGAVPIPQVTVRAQWRGRPVYLVPRPLDDAVVVGATQYESSADRLPRAAGVRTLLTDADELYPGLDEYLIGDIAVGYRPGTPDDRPYIGPLPPARAFTAAAANTAVAANTAASAPEAARPAGVRDRLWAAAGHGRHGVLWSALTAEMMRQWLAGSTPAGGEECDPRRLGEAR